MTLTADQCPPVVSTTRPFDPHAVRADFPILSTTVYGKPLVYLDNGATTQKPRAVIDAISRYYEEQNANIHRGVYRLSQVATEAYESARERVARFINAPEHKQVIFTRGTTEGINLVASSWGRANLTAGDEVVVSAMEHHSNIVPWQIVADEVGAELRIVTVTDDGVLDIDDYVRALDETARFVALVHVSNALGTINPVKTAIELARERGIPVLLDGAQAVQHLRVDVASLDCDFYAFSGHKLYGPTGIGILYGKECWLKSMRPYQGGGDMIASVTFSKTTYADIPMRFEAGTPNIAGAIGLGVAIDYVQSVGLPWIQQHESELLRYARQRLREVAGLRVLGDVDEKAAVLSFTIDGVHPHDIGTVLDHSGVAIRAGHHCAQPLMNRLGVQGTARASFAMYNDMEDVDALVDALRNVDVLRPTSEVCRD